MVWASEVGVCIHGVNLEARYTELIREFIALGFSSVICCVSVCELEYSMLAANL
jgi:hypothetical protein